MPTFSYTARDRTGNQTNGVIAAGSVEEVRESLRKKELFVTQLNEQAATEEKSRPLSRKKVKLGDMVVMSRQLATLVKAGLSIVECLGAVAAQTKNPTLVEVLNDIRLKVLTGSTLTDAMRKHPDIMNEMYVSLVQAGETSGVLDQTLEIAAKQFDQEAELREKVRAAFVYPILVVVASFALVIFMLVFIVPVFAKVYSEFKAELPAVTQTMISMSHVFRHYWWMVLAAMFGAMTGLKRYVKTPGGRWLYDKLKLKLPLLGELNRKIAVSRFTQSFAGAVKAGVPIVRALTISSQVSGSVIIMNAVTKVAGKVQEGSPLAPPLEQSGEFPPMVTRMIMSGEQSGNLDAMLDEITHFYERDIEYTVNKLTRLLEPLMTVVVGAIVLFVLIALYMPIFSLSKVVKH